MEKRRIRFCIICYTDPSSFLRAFGIKGFYGLSQVEADTFEYFNAPKPMPLVIHIQNDFVVDLGRHFNRTQEHSDYSIGFYSEGYWHDCKSPLKWRVAHAIVGAPLIRVLCE